MAARFGQDTVTMLDFEEAKDKVMMGAERKSMVLSEKEKKLQLIMRQDTPYAYLL